MREFELGILTPEGEAFSGNVQSVFVRTTSGEVGILAGHTDYLAGVIPCVAVLESGEGSRRVAFCGGGFASVVAGKVTLVVDEFVFSDNLDADRLADDKKRISEQLSACDRSKEPERFRYLKDAVARAEAKSKAAAEK